MVAVIIVVCQDMSELGSPGVCDFDFSSLGAPGGVSLDPWWSSVCDVPGCLEQSVELCELVEYHPLDQHSHSCHVTSLCEPFVVYSACGVALVV